MNIFRTSSGTSLIWTTFQPKGRKISKFNEQQDRDLHVTLTGKPLPEAVFRIQFALHTDPDPAF